MYFIILIIAISIFYLGYFTGVKREKIKASFSNDLEYVVSVKEMMNDLKDIEQAKKLYKELSKKMHPDKTNIDTKWQQKINKYKKSYTILKKIEKELEGLYG